MKENTHERTPIIGFVLFTLPAVRNYFLSFSLNEVYSAFPKVLQEKLKDFLRTCMSGHGRSVCVLCTGKTIHLRIKKYQF
jgi:hypothetical protein